MLRARWVGVVLAAVGWYVASWGCAQGTSSTDGGKSTTTGTTAGSGGSGGIASTGTGATGATGGTANPGGGGVGGWPCDEDPCKLTLPQCGCPPGDKCDLTSSGRQCIIDGSVAGGEVCSGNNCVAGHVCVGFGGPPTSCFKYCSDNADCSAPGGLCVLEVTAGTYSEMVCSNNCDPATSTGCSVAGTKCTVGISTGPPEEIYTVCIPAGAGTQGSACTDTTDCAAGYHCFGPDNQCLHWCNLASPSCPGGTTCSAVDPEILIGAVEYGACG